MIRIGLIGCGRVAARVHLKELQRLERGTLVALAEVDAERRAAAARAAPGAEVFEDPTGLLKSDVDAVMICTPPATHAPLATAALEAGKHVYVEKPLAHRLEDAESLADLAEASDRVAAVGLNFRFHPLIVEAKRRLEAGALGRLTAVRTLFTTRPRALPEWKRTPDSGGGVLLDLLSHHADLVPFLLDQPVTEVMADLRSVRSQDDTASVLLEMGDGTLVQSLVSMAGIEADQIELIGDQGGLLFDRHWRRSLTGLERSRPSGWAGRIRHGIDGAIDAASLWRDRAAPPVEQSFRRAFAAWLVAIENGVPAAVPLSAGVGSLRVVEAARRAAAEGRSVSVGPHEGTATWTDTRKSGGEGTQMNEVDAPVEAAAGPAMTVVLVTADHFETISRTLAAVAGQTIANRLEVLLVAPDAAALADLRPQHVEGFASFALIYVGPVADVDKAAAPALEQANAPVVALVEDHAYPEPTWAEAILEAHDGPWAAVGSTVVNANPSTALSWVNQLMAYGEWTEPVRGGEGSVSRHNVSFKSAWLAPYHGRLEDLLGRGGGLFGDLKRRGGRFWVAKEARVRHVNPSRFASTVALRLNGARINGAGRARDERWTPWQRTIHAATWPLIPLTRFKHLLPKALGPALRRRALTVVPLLIGALLLDGLGKALGFAFGPGPAAGRMADFEFQRHRHLTAGDRRQLAFEPG